MAGSNCTLERTARSLTGKCRAGKTAGGGNGFRGGGVARLQSASRATFPATRRERGNGFDRPDGFLQRSADGELASRRDGERFVVTAAGRAEVRGNGIRRALH